MGLPVQGQAGDTHHLTQSDSLMDWQVYEEISLPPDTRRLVNEWEKKTNKWIEKMTNKIEVGNEW